MKQFTKEQKAQINYAFSQLCAEEDAQRPILLRPFASGSLVCATNAKVLATCSRGALPVWHNPPTNKVGRCPNPRKVIHPHDYPYVINTEQLLLMIIGLEDDECVKIEDTCYMKGQLIRLATFWRLMGIEHVRCGFGEAKKPEYRVLYCEAKIEGTNRQMLTMMCMPCAQDKYKGRITLDKYNGEDITTHVENATEMYLKKLAQDEANKKEEEAREAEWNWDMYEVTMHVCHTIYVKAHTWEEAKKIAEGAYISDSDVDMDWEIESYSECDRHYAQDTCEADGYYHKDGNGDMEDWPDDEDEEE